MGKRLSDIIKQMHEESERYAWGLIMWDLNRYLCFIRKGDFVLEVGCHSRDLERHVRQRGADYIGIDITVYRRKPHVICDGSTLPFKNGVFDQVWSIHVLEHLTNPYGYLAECERVLKNGGITINQVGMDWKDPTHLYWLDDECLKRLARRAGLKVVTVHRNAPNIATIVAKKWRGSRVCILAFDGLDYYLVEKFRIRELLQAECGIITHEGLPEIANTTMVWASFITGLPPKEHGIDRADIPQKTARIRRGVRTIFDLAEKPIALWIPAYNPHPEYWSPRQIQAEIEAYKGYIQRQAFKGVAYDFFSNQVNEFKSKFKEDWDLLMAHFNFADMIGHVFGGVPTEMYECYSHIASFVGWVEKNLEPETILLIVSDHGITKRGDTSYGAHTRYGFYSSNVWLGLEKPTLTGEPEKPTFMDFYDIISEKLRT